MKRLVFKKWVEYLVVFNLALGWVIVGAFEWSSFIPYLFGILMMFTSSVLLGIFGRENERRTIR